MKRFKMKMLPTVAASLVLASYLAMPAQSIAAQPELEVIAQWNRLTWDLGDPVAEKAFNENQDYKKAMLHGVKVDTQGNMYVSTARWGGPQVPATLSKLVKKEGQWVLQPFPNKAYNDINNPDGLKAVLGFEIDRNNIMWILDQGHIAGAPNKPGDAKLIGWDLTHNREIARYTFTNKEADFTCSFLNDVAVDNDAGVIYITDSGIMCHPLKGGLLVYNMRTNKVRRVLNAPEWVNDQPGFTFKIHGRDVLKYKDGQPNSMRTGADGIALSGDKKTLYWTNLTDNRLLRIPTATLRDPKLSETDLEKMIRVDSVLPSNTDGMTSDRKGNIYMTALTLNGLMKRDAYTGKVTTLLTNDDIAWPDTLSWGPGGTLYFTSNHLNLWADGDMNFDNPAVANFRIYRIQLNEKPYTAK